MAVEVLISYLTRKRRGDVARREERAEGEIIRLGRGADCQIYLPDPRVPLLHSEIHERDGRLHMETVGPSHDLKLNGASVTSARLDPGSKIGLGPYELVAGTQEDGTVTLSVELIRPLGDDFADLDARSRTRVQRVALSKRGWSWLMFIVVMAVALAAPLLASLDRAQEKPLARPGGEAAFLAKQIGWSGTADSFWESGAMSRPHQNFAADCGSCHQKPFIQVRDGACLTCHAKIEHHADAVSFQSASFKGEDCASCHKEHTGTAPMVMDSQAFCVSCHAGLSQREAKTNLQDASDFGTGHPEFRPSVVVNAMGPVLARMEIGGDPKPVEKSGLKFPHAKHLDKRGVKHPIQGTVRLECADCHREEPGGQGMLPIAMEAHCHDCHGLQFDPAAPTRLLPHGKPRESVEQMREFYSKSALHGGVEDPKAPASVRLRRRPGIGLSPQDSAVSLNWALQKAADVATETIGKRACGTCHVVTPPGPGDAGIWDVVKPRLAARWMPKGRFDHAQHRQTACVECHDAAKSKTAMDVLLPGIETCRDCHGGEQAVAKVATTCVSCHDFHRHGLPPLKATANKALP